MMRNLNAIATIATRDFTKLFRDRRRLVFSLIFPVVFIGILGTSFQSNLGESVPFNFLAYTFTGVIAQVLFQSTASGVISIVEDRENDFAQEMFIAPVSRYAIIFGKIVGETMVASVQGIVVIIAALALGVEMSLTQVLLLIPGMLVAALVGGSFGVLVMANLSDQRSANQIFPLILFPQYFLAGVFSPVRELPGVLLLLSRLAPLTYVVDFARNLFYWRTPEAEFTVLNPWYVNIGVMVFMFLLFLIIGTVLFVRNERNR